jgi:sarcosine oxidase subunit gamma
MAKAAPRAKLSVAPEPAGPLDGLVFARPGIELSPLPFCERVSVRADKPAELAASLGVKLPAKPKTSATAKGVTALWLGPDEWLVMAEPGKNLAAIQPPSGTFASIVDVSHRNVAIRVAGTKAATVLASGCPQDLSLAAFPPGACSRTVLGKCEIVLLRTAETGFRLECWRSFSDYVWKFLVDAARSA